MKAVVTGMIASYPVGGVAWDYGQYAVGLERLGFDVYYLEDTGWLAYNPETHRYTEDCSYSIGFLQDSLERLSPSLAKRWIFRSTDGRLHTPLRESLSDILGEVDIFLNVSGGTLLRDDYLKCRNKVLIDTDPGWNHFRNYPKWDANPNWQDSHGYRAHDHFFTYAERINRSDCLLPNLGIHWHPTRPPVVVDFWQSDGPGDKWTTVMTWKNFSESIEYDGISYGTKEMEFPKIQDLPDRVNAALEIAVGGDHAPRQEWQRLGWTVTDAHSVSNTLDLYRQYIQRSRGECSVAKNVYMATHSGWFSCRSTCYLAASRPVVVQDTGFSDVIPVGEGLLSFSNLDEASQAIALVEADYEKHQRAARALALTHFDSQIVLSEMLNRIGV